MSPSYAESVASNEEEQQCPRHVAHRYTWLLRVVREGAATKWVASIAAAAQLVRATIDAIAIIVGGGG
jgi:hypothetical protein